jgi:ubiquinone/menaquinone biosynthesis C-methylase UbiE
MTDPEHDRLRPGTAEYEEHVREEINHYGAIYKEGEARDTLVQPVPASWVEMEARAAALIQAATGHDLFGHVIKHLARRPDSRMLSLGSGPGGVEIDIARHAPTTEIVCTDINRQLLDLGRQRAQQLGLKLTFVEADLNTIELPTKEFDVVFCHASLHHVIELERLAEQIRKSLRDGGVLIAVDVVARNGYLMWPETRDIVQMIWKTLPRRFRFNHTAYHEPRVDNLLFEAEAGLGGMECARSEHILPALEQNFTTRHFVPYYSICRRFFDTMYGPNYDLTARLDRAILDWIWKLDRHYLLSGFLRPESFFGVYEL